MITEQYSIGYEAGYQDGWNAATDTHPAPQPKAEQEPVAWQWLNTANFRKKLPADANKAEWNPLYAAPQPRKRLTNEQIIEWVESGEYNVTTNDWASHIAFARAIEAAVWGEKT